jgi:hypothetical protein
MTVKDLEVGQTLNLSIEVLPNVWKNAQVTVRESEEGDDPETIEFEEGGTVLVGDGDDELELEVVRLRPKEMLVDLFSFDIGGLYTVAFKISQVDSTLKSGVLDDNPRAPDESFGTRRGNSAVE